MKKLITTATILVASLASNAALAEASSEVTAAADSFKSFFTDNSALIGGAMLTMAFIAVGWKWIKGMSFS